ncbi:TIGR02678 family protein OS=Streptomyces tendae OX=1932 GN=GUR47_16925 PE=4 SV=1 [Streptomyces tendae]
MNAGTGDRGGEFVDGVDRGRTDRLKTGRGPVTGGGAVLFSDAPGGGVPSAAAASARHGATGAGAASVPAARPAPSVRPGGVPARARKAGRWAKVAQRIVPDDLQPEVLRLELTELGDAFRAYQGRPEPDLAVLAELHDRKARAFALWADVSGDASLREEADRAAVAARTTREMDANRRGLLVDGEGPAIERLLTRGQGVHARNVLEHVRARSPLPGADARLAVLMLTLRAARAGTGNVTGQDLGGWLASDAEQVLRELVDAGWLVLPEGVTAEDVLMSRPEEPTQVTVPTLIPTQPRSFFFGKVTRARLSGWAQKVVGDRKLRKKKAGPATRLLAVYTAAHSRPDGRLASAGEDGDGLALDAVASFCGLRPEDVAEHAGLLVAADWLVEDVDTAGERLRGRLAERVLPLSGLL